MNIAQSSYDINSNSGLAFINQLFESLPSIGNFRLCETKSRSNNSPYFSTIAIIKALIALLSLGKSNFEDIKSFKDDTLMKILIGLDRIPSAEIFRQRINNIACSNDIMTYVDAVIVELLKHVKDLGTEKIKINKKKKRFLLIDIDVSILVSDHCSKEGVEWTYKNVEGFAPIFASIGSYGYQLANELRPGSTHSQKNAVEFVERIIKIARQISDLPLLIRMDSAHDSDKMFAKLFEHENVYFIIKRNPRCQLPRLIQKAQYWIETLCIPSEKVSDLTTRYCGRLNQEKTESTQNAPLLCIFDYLVTKREGEFDIMEDEKLHTYWTNLPIDAHRIVTLYRDRGTSEQFHSELKTDLGIERLPSQSFATNSLILSLSTIAFNLLRFIGQDSFRHGYIISRKNKVKKQKRLRIRSVLLNFMYVGVLITKHARKVSLLFGRSCHQYKTIVKLHKHFIRI